MDGEDSIDREIEVSYVKLKGAVVLQVEHVKPIISHDNGIFIRCYDYCAGFYLAIIKA